MCYDVAFLTKKKKAYADRLGNDFSEIDKLERQLEILNVAPVYHTTAFDHWKLPVITSEAPDQIQLYNWGFMPSFIKDMDQYNSRYTSRYLNSRIETLFDEQMYNGKLGRDLENPFYKSVLERRCIVLLDGYFDWHWQGKNSYNFLVQMKNKTPMLVAGIWRTWQSKEKDVTRNTLSMVTTDANPLCRKVHNKPKASEGPRQLAMLDNASALEWISLDSGEEQLKKVIRVFPENELDAFPVKKLFHQSGRTRISLNDPDCLEMASFPELKFGQEDQIAVQGQLF